MIVEVPDAVDWVITLPQSIDWVRYELELEDVKSFASDMLFRVPKFCKSPRRGDRCFVIHRGRVMGWMRITGLVTINRGWSCETTGKIWPAGRYLMRSGPFNYLDDTVRMKHCRGIRRYIGYTRTSEGGNNYGKESKTSEEVWQKR